MILYDDCLIRKYEIFIREIIESSKRNIDLDKLELQRKLFTTATKEKFKFDKSESWKFLTSCLDTIGDSQFAIIHFQNGKLENHKEFNTGERYLILYGLLSAVYIQQQSIIKLAELFKLRDFNLIKDEFKTLKITELRHYISAHPVNFSGPGKIESFKIDRSSMTDEKCVTVINENNNSIHFRIFEMITEYGFTAEMSLKKVGEKLIENLYKKSSSQKMKELLREMNKIKYSR